MCVTLNYRLHDNYNTIACSLKFTYYTDNYFRNVSMLSMASKRVAYIIYAIVIMQQKYMLTRIESYITDEIWYIVFDYHGIYD